MTRRTSAFRGLRCAILYSVPEDIVEDEKSIHLVQELCTGGELFDRIIDRGHYTEHDAKILLHALLQAVNHW